MLAFTLIASCQNNLEVLAKDKAVDPKLAQLSSRALELSPELVPEIKAFASGKGVTSGR
jgi:hypothetical protein